VCHKFAGVSLTALLEEVLVAGNCRFLCTAQGGNVVLWDGHLSNEKRAPGCFGGFVGG